MKRNINFKNVLCMAAITLVTGMLGGCEDNSIATPVGKLPNETALDNNFGMLKCDMTTSDLEITMTNTKTPDFAFFYQTVKPVAQDTRITMKIDLDLVDKYNEEHGITPTTIKKAVRDLIAISTAVENPHGSDEKDLESMSAKELNKLVKEIQKKMHQAAAELNFEEAAVLRDRMLEVKKMLLDME